MTKDKARRSTAPRRLPTPNPESVGLLWLCLAGLLALALVLPAHQTGTVGHAAASVIRIWLGASAWFGVAIILCAGIATFMETKFPWHVLFTAGCAVVDLCAASALFGVAHNGGIIGNAIGHAAIIAFGRPSATLLLGTLTAAFIVMPTGLSIKDFLHGVRNAAGAAHKSVGKPARRALIASARTSLRWFESAANAIGTWREERAKQRAAEATRRPARLALPSAVRIADAPSPPTPAQRRQEQADTSRVVKNPEPERKARATRSRQVGRYRLPDLSIFNSPVVETRDAQDDTKVLEETLAAFGIGVTVTHIERGPSVTRYELAPGRGVKVAAVKSLSDNIQLALAAQSVRIEAPIPGKAAIGIEVPNRNVSSVVIRDVLAMVQDNPDGLPFALGKNVTGVAVTSDLTRMPHLLVAGATGAGKSVCLNVIIASLMATKTPDRLRLLLIDPKRVELIGFNGVPHLLRDCITDPKVAAGALHEITKEMDSRYERFAKAGVRKIEEYNGKHADEPLPYIVVVIDELADLMLVAPTRVETSICRIAQLARATGIHLVVATQRPSVDVITGLIKANIPSRIAFAVSSQIDSRTIIDQAGAERLLGRGDMLYLPIDAPKPLRTQGALVTNDEIERLCDFWREQDAPDDQFEFNVEAVDDEEGLNGVDELAFPAARCVVERQMASVALLQAELKVGHPRAVRLMKILEDRGIVGPTEGTKPRRILVGDADMPRVAALLGASLDALDQI